MDAKKLCNILCALSDDKHLNVYNVTIVHPEYKSSVAFNALTFLHKCSSMWMVSQAGDYSFSLIVASHLSPTEFERYFTKFFNRFVKDCSLIF